MTVGVQAAAAISHDDGRSTISAAADRPLPETPPSPQIAWSAEINAKLFWRIVKCLPAAGTDEVRSDRMMINDRQS